MAQNDATFEQGATILNELYNQATGQNAVAAQDLSSFISMATAVQKSMTDQLGGWLTQMIDRTIFSIRPYTADTADIEVSEQKWGNQVRKLTPIYDSAFFTDDSRLPLISAQENGTATGDGVDMFKVKTNQVLQTNFYGGNRFENYITYFRDQLDTAFRGPEELASYVSMLTTNRANYIELSREVMKKAAVNNFIGAKLSSDAETDNRIHLLTDYNTLTGLTLTSTTVYLPDNFPSFMKYVVARIKTICQFMTEMTTLYHTNISNKAVARHTPFKDQMIYLYTPLQFLTETAVLSDLYNDQYMKLANFKRINYWQNMNEPERINVTPSYMDENGIIQTASTAVDENHIFGVIFDREAIGTSLINHWTSTTPFNSRGGYYTMWEHWTMRYWNDMTENGVVLLLD